MYTVSANQIADILHYNDNIYDKIYLIANSLQQTLHKKRSSLLKISSVNLNTSVVSCRFGYIYIFNGKHFLCNGADIIIMND